MEKSFLSESKESSGVGTRDRILLIVSIVCAILCVGLCIACLVSVSRATKGIETVVQEVQEMKQTSAELTERITSLETKVASTQAMLKEEAASKYIKITKQPSSVSTYVGRTDAMLFSVKAEGIGLRFTWQKFNNAKNAWEELVFDGNGFNTDLGIRLYSDTANGESQLWTKDFKANSFGQYRCLISDSQGTQVYSDAIQIQEKAAP